MKIPIKKAFEIVVQAALDAGWSNAMVVDAVERALPREAPAAATTYGGKGRDGSLDTVKG